MSKSRPGTLSRVVVDSVDDGDASQDFSSQMLGRAWPYMLPQSESEEARQNWRTVYDFPQWVKHRSSTRLIERLVQIPRSHILRNSLPSIAWCTSVATLVTIYMNLYENGHLGTCMPSLEPNDACQAFVNYTTTALSLLLVFRTNAAYGRWDEARKMQGTLVNRSRDLIRQACQVFPEAASKEKEAIARWVIALSQVIRLHLQPDGLTLESQLSSVLSEEELGILLRSSHRPVTAIAALGQIISDVPIHSVLQARLQAQMYESLSHLHDILGGSERILRAPIPVSYTRHTARFLFSWLTCLPFALYASCGPWVIPVVAGIAAVLCGIEEIGVQVEEPFGILPLEMICKRISADVTTTLESHEEIRSIIRNTTKH